MSWYICCNTFPYDIIYSSTTCTAIACFGSLLGIIILESSHVDLTINWLLIKYIQSNCGQTTNVEEIFTSLYEAVLKCICVQLTVDAPHYVTALLPNSNNAWLSHESPS